MFCPDPPFSISDFVHVLLNTPHPIGVYVCRSVTQCVLTSGSEVGLIVNNLWGCLRLVRVVLVCWKRGVFVFLLDHSKSGFVGLSVFESAKRSFPASVGFIVVEVAILIFIQKFWVVEVFTH